MALFDRLPRAPEAAIDSITVFENTSATLMDPAAAPCRQRLVPLSSCAGDAGAVKSCISASPQNFHRSPERRWEKVARVTGKSRCLTAQIGDFLDRLAGFLAAAVGLSGRLGPAEVIVADELLKKLAGDCMPLTNQEFVRSRITHDFCTPG